MERFGKWAGRKSLVFALALALLCAVLFPMLTACGGEEEEEDTVQYTVTFDLNYDGSESVGVTVAEGGTVEAPEVERDGYELLDWYTDADCTDTYDFTETVTADMTLYAEWKDLSKIYYTVTYHYNNGEEDYVREYEENTRLTSVSDPEYDGYIFYGWYTSEDYEEKYVFGYRITENIDLYARWGQQYTFEAEDISFSGLVSPVYSGTTSGRGLIVQDIYDRGASNGYYVMGQYATNDSTYSTTLTFNIVASEATDDAQLVLRLSAAYGSFSINGDEYQVSVNGSTYYYEDIEFTLPSGVDAYSAYVDFEDYVISTNVSLVEGDNVIELIVNNSESLGGTTKAKAPCVDCLKIATADGTLSWADGFPKDGNY